MTEKVEKFCFMICLCNIIQFVLCKVDKRKGFTGFFILLNNPILGKLSIANIVDQILSLEKWKFHYLK